MPWHLPPAVAPCLVAIAARLVAWAFVSPSRFASDEASYFQVATALLERGHHDVFWPPVTGWLIAAARWVLRTDAVPAIRLVWIAIDIGSVAAVYTLARRALAPASNGTAGSESRLAALTAVAYALYLPAISYAQFTTSETPALFQLLLVLVIMTGASRPPAHAVAGLLLGALVLTRPSVLPLVVMLPPMLVLDPSAQERNWSRALVFFLLATTVVGAGTYRTWRLSGVATIATNSSYNLYIGNRDMYGEDLNLFAPRATPEQIEFRQQMWSGELQYPSQPPAQLQREAIAWIAAHPGEFGRRALGRLARVFAPRTDVLELAGGEQHAGLSSPVPLALLAIANAQWTVALFGGLVGLFAIGRSQPRVAAIFGAAIAGSLLLCLVAISKPRYSFVFDPLLLVGATAVAVSPRMAWSGLTIRARWIVAAAIAFLLWGWAAWFVFAFTSRAAL